MAGHDFGGAACGWRAKKGAEAEDKLYCVCRAGVDPLEGHLVKGTGILGFCKSAVTSTES